MIESINLRMADITPNSDYKQGYMQALNDMVDVAKELVEVEKNEMIRFGNDCVENFHTDWNATCSVAEHVYNTTYNQAIL